MLSLHLRKVDANIVGNEKAILVLKFMETMWQNPFLTKYTIDIALPAICPVTGHIVDSPGQVHPDYWQTLHFITAPYCEICGLPHIAFGNNDSDKKHDIQCASCLENPPFFDGHRTALSYDDASKMLILKFKHQDHQHLVKTFTPWLNNATYDFTNIDIITPVPLHYRRLLYRRYNQAALLAKALAQHKNLSYKGDILKRIRATESQGHKSPAERAKNVEGAFSVKSKYTETLKNKTILLVDDVYTTGATLNACAKALKNAGAATIYSVTIARAFKDN